MVRQGIYLALLVLILSCGVACANTFDVVYSVEKGEYRYCEKEAKYELKITIKNLESEKIDGTVEPTLLIGDESIHPCYPSYRKRVFRTEPQGADEVIFYFKDFPSSASISVVLEFNGKSEIHLFPPKVVTTTVTTTTKPTPTPSGDQPFSFLTRLDESLMEIYKNHFQPVVPHIGYEVFRILVFAVPSALIGGGLVVLRSKRQQKYEVEVPITDEYYETERSFKLFANCAKCGKREYMPFRCNYCGEYFSAESTSYPQNITVPAWMLGRRRNLPVPE